LGDDAMSLADALDQVRLGIVQITLSAFDLADNAVRNIGRHFFVESLGTGFSASQEGCVITAYHVMEYGRHILDGIEAHQKSIQVGLPEPNTETMRGNFALVDFDIVDEDKHHDLALLRLRRNPLVGEVLSGFSQNGRRESLRFSTMTLHPKRPRDGAAVGISGYPLETSVLVTNAGWMATSWEIDVKESQVPGAPEWYRKIDVADVYLADVEVNPGNSGAPVYLIDNGKVIGVCVASKPAPVRDQHDKQVAVCGRELYYSSGLTIVVPIRYAIDLLRKHNLSYVEAED